MSPGQLTAQEAAVLLLVSRGLTNDEIGALLCVTEQTANFHVRCLIRKFGAANRAALAARAVALGHVKLADLDSTAGVLLPHEQVCGGGESLAVVQNENENSEGAEDGHPVGLLRNFESPAPAVKDLTEVKT